jgi:hypothetical protein
MAVGQRKSGAFSFNIGFRQGIGAREPDGPAFIIKAGSVRILPSGCLRTLSCRRRGEVCVSNSSAGIARLLKRQYKSRIVDSSFWIQFYNPRIQLCGRGLCGFWRDLINTNIALLKFTGGGESSSTIFIHSVIHDLYLLHLVMNKLKNLIFYLLFFFNSSLKPRAVRGEGRQGLASLRPYCFYNLNILAGSARLLFLQKQGLAIVLFLADKC